jgi:UDP-N-acetylglucosamine transferase subunit ALG13
MEGAGAVLPAGQADRPTPLAMSTANQDPKALIFVTLGTDHHPFDRLVRWVDGWLADGANERARCLVQTGRSLQPKVADAVDFLSYEDMRRVVQDAAAVVTHGGPGSIALAVAFGRRPLVVPRRKSLGEHVDDHQVVFARRIAAEGKIELAEQESEFLAALEHLLAAPPGRPAESVPQPIEAAARIEIVVHELLHGASTRRQ